MANGCLLLSATFTVQPIRQALSYWCAQLGLDMPLEFGPTGQVFQQLLDPTSQTTANRGVNVMLIRTEDLVPAAHGLESPGPAALEQEAQRMVRSIDVYLQHTGRALLVLVCPPSPRWLEAFDVLHQECERRLASYYFNHEHVTVIASRRILELYPLAEYHDETAYREGLIPYSREMYTALATVVARHLHALFYADSYKVIVVDCDGTLWTGVCGEDGPAGVVVDEGRKGLQAALIEQIERGRLLCLCSRNNEHDVWRVFEENPAMSLRREHIVAWRVNWQPKNENLCALSDQLNLALESFVYLDDDAVVCSEIEALLPAVLTLQVPANSAVAGRFVDHIWAFDKVHVTAEDRKRFEQYRLEQSRRELQLSTSSYEEFLRGLNVEVRLEAMREVDAGRVAQLLIRTTQFNSGAPRAREDELLDGIREGTRLCATVRVRDRFGDYGLSGCLLYALRDDRVVVEAVALSCRILGRGVEDKVLDGIKRIAADAGRKRVDILYHPTERNMPVRSFLQRIGGRDVMENETRVRFQFALGG